MQKNNFYNQGQSLIGIIIVLVVVGLISGGLYYYLERQIPKIPEIAEKPVEEEIVKPEEEVVTPPSEEELPKEEVVPEEVPPEEVTPPEEVVAPPCQDECSQTGLKRCSNNGYQICGNYDADNCLEWSLVTNCPLNTVCQNGSCVSQKCPDGTLYGQCSTNKPKYCENGNLVDRASLCGCPADYKIFNNYCVVEIPQLDLESGLIVIKKGTDGENFARKIASRKRWSFLATAASDYKQIKREILNFYNQKKFDYLLLIGTNEEIPYAIYDSQAQLYKTDPSLYADINNDGFIELAIGRLPFSSEPELEKYFNDLTPKGNFITLEYYPFSSEEDPQDSSTVFEYNYGKCLASFSPSIRVYRNSNIQDLVNHYRESAILELRTHGSDNTASVNETFLNIYSFRKEFDGELAWEGEIEYLTNRPIIVHMSCNNGKILGRELIENGASAFLGFYNPSGYAPIVTQRILSGKTIGEAMKDVYNSNVLTFTEARRPEWPVGKYISIPNIQGLNTFDITDSSQVKGPFFDEYGFILYGDPSLKLPERFQKPDYNVNVQQQMAKIIIEVGVPKLFNVSQTTDLLCYVGRTVSEGSFIIGKDSWPNNHKVMLTFPLTKINRLKSMEIIIGNQRIPLDDFRDEEARINLLKGKTEQYLYVLIDDNVYIQGKVSRLDYTKNLQILINYE
jgi:hypothetical protein